MSFKFITRTIAHVGLSALAGVGIGDIPDAIASTIHPTGGALVYAQAHPVVGFLYLFGTLFTRELLKNVPGLAPQTSTTVGPNAPTQLGTASVKS